MEYPSFIKGKPKKIQDKLLLRMAHEKELIRASFPTFQLMQEDNGELYVEGKLKTKSHNVYTIRIHYTSKYPYEAPIPLVMDKDVIDFCKKGGMHGVHNYGETKGGIVTCVLNRGDSIAGEISWEPDLSAISLIAWTAEWLHAYEVKRAFPNKKWILPE